MNLKLDIEYNVKNVDHKLNIYNNVFSQKNYQLYASRFFQLRSNDLRWVFIDYHTGTGKTTTSLLMTQNNYLCYIIGNQVSHNAFIDDIQHLNYNQELFSFLTYQSFANISESILEQYFQNTIIIVDEFQNLFSQQGLNSYGIQLQKLYQILGDKIKIICLSGTVLNTQWFEIFFIGNIFKGYDYWDTSDIENIAYDSKEKKECVEFLKEHFISYHVILNKDLYPELRYVNASNTQAKVEKMTVIKEDDLLKTKDFPLYLSFDKEVWNMDAQDQQEMLNTANAKTNKDTKTDNNANNTNTDTNNTNLIQTNYILPKYYNDPKKQISNGTIITNQDDILKYSPLSKSFVTTIERLLKDKTCTKIVGYNDRVQYQWGLLQWAQILDNMGFVKYGEPNKQSTLCSECLITFGKHPSKSEAGHVFKPLQYILYYANLSMSERYEYMKIFNNPNNLYGHQCKVILLSEIAETGLSLKAVTDFFLLDNIPGFSQYQQIVARAVRMNSHEELPDDMHFVRVYNLCATDLTKNTPNYQQWQTMFQQGKDLSGVLTEIRSAKEKIDTEMFKSTLFMQQNLQQIIAFLQGQDFNKYLDKQALKKIILNPDLLRIDFQVKSINDDALDYVHFHLFSADYAYNEEKHYINKYIIKELKPIKYMQKIHGETILNLIKNNKSTSLPQVKMFLKDYSSQIIQQIKTLILTFETIYSAWFIYEGFVYIKDDEKHFLENHLKFYSFIWDKTFNYVYLHQDKIVKDFDIQGVYYTNQAFALTANQGIKKITANQGIRKIPVYNNFSDFMKLILYLTQDVPSYQYKNEDFYIFGGKQMYDTQNEEFYNELSLKFQFRYNILYFLKENLFQEPIFDLESQQINFNFK